MHLAKKYFLCHKIAICFHNEHQHRYILSFFDSKLLPWRVPGTCSFYQEIKDGEVKYVYNCNDGHRPWRGYTMLTFAEFNFLVNDAIGVPLHGRL